jgi:hypothetical protein
LCFLKLSARHGNAVTGGAKTASNIAKLPEVVREA